jgi:thiol-disulfide isomerase/thioredoxin
MDETNPRPGVAWWTVAAIFALSWIAYLAYFAPKEEEVAARGVADFRWRLYNLDDKPVDFARYKGKVVFLNVWATWCPPCVREMPSIAALAANPRLKDVEFVCVSTDDSSETVRDFLRDKSGWRMTILRADRIPPVFATDGIPATFIIARDGRIVFAEVGAADWNSAENVERLERLTRESLARR